VNLWKRVPLLAVGWASIAAAQYSITDIGPVHLDTFPYIVINDNGVIAGTDINGNAFRWTNGTVDTFSVPGYFAIMVKDINNSGQIAGAALMNGPGLAVRITGQNLTTHPGPIGGETIFNAINDSGLAAGQYRRQSGASQYFTPGTVSFTSWSGLAFPVGGWTDGRVDSINASGVAAGTGHDVSNGDRALLWIGGEPTVLTSPDSTRPTTYANYLNDNGDLILTAQTSGGSSPNWYLRHNAIYTLLTGPGGSPFSVVALKNDLSMIGTSAISGISHGLLRRPDGSNLDITALLSSSVDLNGFTPRDMNNTGQIVGTGHYGFGESHYFLLTPVRTVSGTVGLQNFSATTLGVPVTIEIRLPGSTTPLDTEIVPLDANGNFTANVSVAPGTYDITVKADHWLRQRLANQTLTTAGASGLSYSLVNGDVNGDNVVSLGDFTRLRAAFGSSSGDPNWNADADLNGDGAVSLGDFTILRAHFGQQGDP
jgi:hypothetical protein